MDAYVIAGYFSGSLGDLKNSSTVASWINQGETGINQVFQQLNKGGLLPKDKDNLIDNYAV